MVLTKEYNIETSKELQDFIQTHYHESVADAIFGLDSLLGEVISNYVLNYYEGDTDPDELVRQLSIDKTINEIHEIFIYGEPLNKYPFLEPHEITKYQKLLNK